MLNHSQAWQTLNGAGPPRLMNAIARLLGVPTTGKSSDSGSGTSPNGYCTVQEFGDDLSGRRTILTFTAAPITISDDAGVAQYGGVQVYDFPLGLIHVRSALVSGILTAGATGTIIDNWDGDVAIGTITATTGATLASTEANIMQSVAVSAGASDKLGVVSAVSAATALTESGSRHLDGTVTAIDAYLNFVIDDNVSNTAGTATFTGKVILNWSNDGTL